MWKRISLWGFAAASSVMVIVPVFNARADEQEPGGASQPASAPVKDDWITSQVKKQLKTAVPGGNHVDVDTKDDVVTLSGSVPTESARMAAVQIAQATEGVKQVKDEIKVSPAK
jgi:hyperosmotically inducible protein